MKSADETYLTWALFLRKQIERRRVASSMSLQEADHLLENEDSRSGMRKRAATVE